MDIIITGEQGAGKTRAAETFLSTFRPAYGKRFAPFDILTIDYYVFGDVAGLVEKLLQSRCRAILFDGCFLTPGDLLTACEAVKEYRKHISADVLAIYTDYGYNVMITNGAGCTCSVPDTKEPRTLTTLRDLYDKVIRLSSLARRERIQDKLNELAGPVHISAGIDELNAEGRITFHSFLLDQLKDRG